MSIHEQPEVELPTANFPAKEHSNTEERSVSSALGTHTESQVDRREKVKLEAAQELDVLPERNTGLVSRTDDQEKVIRYLEGWRLHTLTVACDKPRDKMAFGDTANLFTDYV